MVVQCSRVRLRLRRGLTFTEVLTVVAVLAIVSAIAYPVYTRAKAKSYETSCAARLKQHYQALQMYAADYPGYQAVHRNVDIPNEPMRDPRKLHGYLPRELFYCPETPDCARTRLLTSYIRTAALHVDEPGAPSLDYQLDKRFADPNSGYPIIHCLVHDELHYFPAERELAEALNPPFVIRLKADGSVASGRYAITRGHDIAHACALPRRQR